jgi:cell division protease FtsH
VCNEAALIAARKGKNAVDMTDFQDAVDRVIGGLGKRTKSFAGRKTNHCLSRSRPCRLRLVPGTCLPAAEGNHCAARHGSVGLCTIHAKEQYLYNTDQLNDQICMTLGGRASEDIFFGKISTGAQNDLQQITRIAYAMVTVYGMNNKVGNISYYDPNQDQTFTKPYSEETSKIIDQEVRLLIDVAYERTKQLLLDKKIQVETLAEKLLEKEVLFQSDVEALIGRRPYDEKNP